MPDIPALKTLSVAGASYRFAPIADIPGVDRLPYSLRVVLENLVRQAARGMRDTATVDAEIQNLLAREVGAGLSMFPNRIFGQDILGQVMLVDIAALRDAVADAGGDPRTIEPKVPVDIIIDHSLPQDVYSFSHALLSMTYHLLR